MKIKQKLDKNGTILERFGYIQKNSAGVFTYLPDGLKVLNKISNIIREEINKLNAEEILMPSLIEVKYFEPTKRDNLPIAYRISDYNLGWTHEEVITDLMKQHLSSYRDLPFAFYQVQTKFRNELRAKDGLMRCREFLMKDMYSFHKSNEDFQEFYQKVQLTYLNIFAKLNITPLIKVVDGDTFTDQKTIEFQVPYKLGEDEVQGVKTVEIANIFPLGDRYSKAFNLYYPDKEGKRKFPIMGSYGIGVSRLMGVLAELNYLDGKIIWPF